MTTKKIMEKLLKIGNNFRLFLLFIMIYLIDVIFIFPLVSNDVLSFLDRKPFFLIVTKCSYALLMAVGLLLINKRADIGWFILNASSIGILFIWYYSFEFYTSFIDTFLLEICAVWILVLINRKSFISHYLIRRNVCQMSLIVILPMIILILIHLFVMKIFP